ncbi:MAG: M23 family metallopeptidase [candidate division NC10 bacterium]|nr:M23 family metallopeptidase [candidate division NC10 bacterium]
MPDGPPLARVSSRLGRGSWGLGIFLTALLVFARAPGPVLSEEARLVIRLAPERVKQGGVAVLRTESPTPIRALRVQVGDRRILAASPEGQTPQPVLIGIDLEQPPGTVLVHAEAADGSGRALLGLAPLLILDARFPVQRLTVSRPFVELDAASLERVNREKAVLDRLWETLTPERLWRGPFRIPLEGTGPGVGFGERRIINGEARAPHTGTDYSAPPGAPVLAANAGTVALVADHFFAGTSIILDHGLGLYTMYFHLQESLVQPGQRVERGQAIARVGSTGRATGPHLHWGARLQGARIDPRELLQPLPVD